MARQATSEAPQTAHALRQDRGISLPTLSPEWDLVSTLVPNPSQIIAAFEGNQSEIRITLHLDSLSDNTTTIQLEGLGISHLIGISISDMDNATWQSSDPGGMIAVIDSPATVLPWLLHDVLLDMAMIHAKAQPWSGIRDQLSSHAIAELKAQFVRERNLGQCFPYGTVSDECRYFPLAAFARSNVSGNLDSWNDFNLGAYVELWSDFAVFAEQHADIHLHINRENIPTQIIQSHVNGGQISQAKLSRKIAKLSSGHYCLYLLIRKAGTRAKVAELSTFFHVSKNHLRTLHVIIHPRDQFAKQAAVLLHERYISVFPFFVGEE